MATNAVSGLRTSLLDLDRPELEAILDELDEPRYRARQVWRAVYRRAALDFCEMTDLPLTLRERLATRLDVRPGEVAAEQTSRDGSTTKRLLRLTDGELIETVLMRYESGGQRRTRKTVCVSTQAGCAMGCTFCATGAQGFRRQLSAGEILLQVLTMDRLAVAEGSPITNVVFMGMGEPLANYDATHAALSRLSDPESVGMSPRRITVSTIGLPAGIGRLAEDHPAVNLAVSLHAPNDALRRRLVPLPPVSLAEIVAAAHNHASTTGRRVSFEYVLLAGVNDSREMARELAALLRGVLCHVNLIPLNPAAGVTGDRPSRTTTLAFEAMLQAAGIPTTVRVEKGHDIAAACGQLRGDRGNRGDRKLRTDAGG